ncbi:T-cell surface antigen CD2-like [Phyllopteryx taeniolatus]|uniref:T-cell surface antigen CD2-like n=1 Tax=Phyllopteryx taeniolatus TaxID=161469 RepID=UPI002AD2E672|nr:T-cell surface antigen CD2-like [Phyllopteryx taeniolatus]
MAVRTFTGPEDAEPAHRPETESPINLCASTVASAAYHLTVNNEVLTAPTGNYLDLDKQLLFLKLMMMVQMASPSLVSLLLLCCGLTSTDSRDVCDTYAPVGGSFAVPLRHTLQKSERLKWQHNKIKIFDQKPDGIITGKREDVYENGSLKLTSLKKSSQGEYIPEVFDAKGESVIKKQSLYLCVLDAVPKLSLKMECALPNVKFTCMPAGQTPNATVAWFQNGKVLPQEIGRTVLRVADEVIRDSFACKVSNRVSSMSSESVIQKCIGSKLFGLDFRIMVSILASMGGLALLLLIILIVCCVRAVQEKHKQVQEEGELRLGWTNPEGQQHQCRHPPNEDRHHHPHHRERPAGQTGPRQHRGNRHGEPQQPTTGPRRAAQGSEPAGTGEQAPPLPQPRKKTQARRM